MDRPDDEALLDQFRQWLDDARAEAAALPPVEAGDVEPEVGLYRLTEEFTALRHEVKLQTKSARGLQEEAENLLAGLRQAIELFRAVEPREAQAATRASQPLAEALAELDDALDRGRAEADKARRRLLDEAAASFTADLETLEASQPWYRRRWLRGYHEEVRAVVERRAIQPYQTVLAALDEGYDLVQARLRRVLAAQQIERIACVGRPVDPARMTVVAIVDAPGLPPGQVVEEIRRGYTWRGQVLRFAEVRAARMPLDGQQMDASTPPSS
jgi:molecular chaperone GrpE